MTGREDTYTVRNLLTDTLEDFHATSLHEVMLQDKEEIHIDIILEHRGNTKRLSSLEFKVKWRGLDESRDLWDPWKNLRATDQLHTYLIEQGLHRLIPKNIRENHRDIFNAIHKRDVPLIPIQNFAQQANPDKVKAPRQVIET